MVVSDYTVLKHIDINLCWVWYNLIKLLDVVPSRFGYFTFCIVAFMLSCLHTWCSGFACSFKVHLLLGKIALKGRLTTGVWCFFLQNFYAAVVKKSWLYVNRFQTSFIFVIYSFKTLYRVVSKKKVCFFANKLIT